MPLNLERRGMICHLDDAEWQRLRPQFESPTFEAAGTILSKIGEPLDRSFLLLEGVIGRHVASSETGRSHMVAMQVPGDFVDLHAFPLRRLDHDVVALSDVTIARIPHTALVDILSDSPKLARALWALTLVDAAIHRHWAFRNGSMRALPGVANFLCEYDARMRAAGLGDGSGQRMPLTQEQIGYACGLSSIHVNRVLRDLREAGCCTLRGGQLEIQDREKLESIGRFDRTYLYLPQDTPEHFSVR